MVDELKSKNKAEPKPSVHPSISGITRKSQALDRKILKHVDRVVMKIPMQIEKHGLRHEFNELDHNNLLGPTAFI